MITLGWAVFTTVICSLAWSSLTVVYTSTSSVNGWLLQIGKAAAYGCWTISVLLLLSQAAKRWGNRNVTIVRSDDSPAIEKGYWNNYEVLARARSARTTEIVSGLEIGRTTYAITTLCYIVTSVVTLVIFKGLLKLS